MRKKKIICPECASVAKKIPLELLAVKPDMGHIKCPNCSFTWCMCEEHGTYPCPGPCDRCDTHRREGNVKPKTPRIFTQSRIGKTKEKAEAYLYRTDDLRSR